MTSPQKQTPYPSRSLSLPFHSPCHCEERSDEAIPWLDGRPRTADNDSGDCFPHASLVMTATMSLRAAGGGEAISMYARRLLSPRSARDMRFARNDRWVRGAFPTLRSTTPTLCSGQALRSPTLRSWQAWQAWQAGHALGSQRQTLRMFAKNASLFINLTHSVYSVVSFCRGLISRMARNEGIDPRNALYFSVTLA